MSNNKKLNQLDRAVHAFRRIQRDSWVKMAGIVCVIRDGELWRERVDEHGNPVHKSFGSFCQIELNMSRNYINVLTRVVVAFDSDTLLEIGPAKAYVVLQTASAHRKQALKMATSGVSVRALNRFRLEHSAPPKPVGGPRGKGIRAIRETVRERACAGSDEFAKAWDQLRIDYETARGDKQIDEMSFAQLAQAWVMLERRFGKTNARKAA
jgi:hypothetical protein